MANKGDGSNAAISDSSSPEMLKERKSTGEKDKDDGVEMERCVRGWKGYNEGQISLGRCLEIGWPFGVCDISLKVLWAANSSSDSHCWHAIHTIQYVSKE